MLALGPDWRVWDERGTWAKAALMLHTDAAEMFLDNACSPAAAAGGDTGRRVPRSAL
jgi:hypothetical protein